MLTVINDILDFSKVEAGKVELELRDFNLRDCLETTLKTIANRADEKGLELLCDIALDVPEVTCGDSTRLRQIILNLVGNSIKFTHEGEVALTVELESSDADSTPSISPSPIPGSESRRKSRVPSLILSLRVTPPPLVSTVVPASASPSPCDSSLY